MRLIVWLAAVAGIAMATWSAHAEIAARDGWVVIPTKHAYKTLTERVKPAAKNQKLGVVTRASATVGAKAVFDKVIPGNMVVGLYHPRFAVPMLEASVAAGIEAPIRIYLTENEDGTATLSYKKPTAVFAPYFDEGGDKLRGIAEDLDTVFANLAAELTAE